MNLKKNLLVTILFLWLTLIVWNFSYAKDYEYKNLNIKADLNIDGTIDVKETFTTNFLEKRHWITRSIPLDYSVDGVKFILDISDINVEWSKFTTEKQNWNLEIKIWDIDETVIWEQIYPISYSAYWLVKNFSWMWYSELYWNIVWYDVDTDINSVNIEINLSKQNYFNAGDFLITVDWKEKSVWNFAWKIDWSKWDKITIKYNKNLPAWEWITLAIKFPNDYFEFNHDDQAWLLGNINKWQFNYKNLNSATKTLVCAVWILIFFFWIMYVSKNWLHKSIKPVEVWKDFESKYPLIVQYTPPKWMNSAEAWLLFNCRVDPVDMTSLFYQWAKDKLIKINYDVEGTSSNKIKSVTFVKLNDIPETYPYYERELFYGIFRNKDSKYINESTDLSKIVSLEWLEDFWLHKHWLCRGKHLSFLWIILSILFFGLLVLWFYYFKWLWVLFLVLFVPLFSWLVFKQNNKIRLTEKWWELAAHVIWYAKFIKECDENVLKEFLKQDPLFIDKTLPYAVAFGLETEFLKKVTPLLKDIEQTWLKWWKSSISFPVWNISSFVKKILWNPERNRNLLSYGLYSLTSWWNYKPHSSYTKQSWSNINYNRNYDKLKWFDVWSIFSWWWKLFKKWGWGGWWGTRSW